MANPMIIPGDVVITGNLKVGSFTSPDASVDDDAIQTNAKVAYSKLEHKHSLEWRPPRKNVPFKITSPRQNIDNGAATTVDHALRHFAKAGEILAARIVYDIETTGTVAGATTKLGVTSGGEEVVAATAYENTKAVGSITELTIADGEIAAGETLRWRHTGIAATAAGEAHLEIDAVEFDGTVFSCEEELHIVYGVDGTVTSVELSCGTAPTSTSSFTLDVQKWNGSTWATILDTPISVTSATMTADNQVLSDIPTNGTLADGNKLKIIIATTGPVSSQAQDLQVTIFVAEKPLTT